MEWTYRAWWDFFPVFLSNIITKKKQPKVFQGTYVSTPQADQLHWSVTDWQTDGREVIPMPAQLCWTHTHTNMCAHKLTLTLPHILQNGNRIFVFKIYSIFFSVKIDEDKNRCKFVVISIQACWKFLIFWAKKMLSSKIPQNKR